MHIYKVLLVLTAYFYCHDVCLAMANSLEHREQSTSSLDGRINAPMTSHADNAASPCMYAQQRHSKRLSLWQKQQTHIPPLFDTTGSSQCVDVSLQHTVAHACSHSLQIVNVVSVS